MEAYLGFRHISKTFPGVTALDDITWDLETGKVHGLMGKTELESLPFSKFFQVLTCQAQVLFGSEELNGYLKIPGKLSCRDCRNLPGTQCCSRPHCG
jgi:hypothetical protein